MASKKHTLSIWNDNVPVEKIARYSTKHVKYTFKNQEKYKYTGLYNVLTLYLEYYTDYEGDRVRLYMRRDFRVNGKDYVREFLWYEVN